MYTYTAGATGLDAAMPPWVQDGGLEAWIERLQGPGQPRPRDRRDARAQAGVGEPGTARRCRTACCCWASRIPPLKPLTGKTLAEVAKAAWRVAARTRPSTS